MSQNDGIVREHCFDFLLIGVWRVRIRKTLCLLMQVEVRNPQLCVEVRKFRVMSNVELV